MISSIFDIYLLRLGIGDSDGGEMRRLEARYLMYSTYQIKS